MFVTTTEHVQQANSSVTRHSSAKLIWELHPDVLKISQFGVKKPWAARSVLRHILSMILMSGTVDLALRTKFGMVLHLLATAKQTTTLSNAHKEWFIMWLPKNAKPLSLQRIRIKLGLQEAQHPLVLPQVQEPQPFALQIRHFGTKMSSFVLNALNRHLTLMK